MTIITQRALTWDSGDVRKDGSPFQKVEMTNILLQTFLPRYIGWPMLSCIVGVGDVSNQNPNLITLINRDIFRNIPPTKEKQLFRDYFSSPTGGR